jgi:twitching motility protein PilT
MSVDTDRIRSLLEEAAVRHATEIYLKVPNRPNLRINGRLVPTTEWALNPQSSRNSMQALCDLARIELPLGTINQREFSFGLSGLGRFHVNLYRQRGSLAAVIQRVGTRVLSLSEVGIPISIEQSVGQPGLMIVAGKERQAGLAALVHSYNASRRGYVVLLERPLTFLHRDAMAIIAHREVCSDVPTFADGIAHAVSMSANLLAIGDIEDVATAKAALIAAERGVPTIASVAATDVEHAMWWITRLFQQSERADLSERLARVVHQTLVVDTVDLAQTESTPGHNKSIPAMAD